MKRSVQNYLQRCTTEELIEILQHCVQNYKNYSDIIPDILKILEERNRK